MKILHTADWHLGKRLDRFERLPEQIDVLNEICQIADSENVDLVLIAGDLYDTFNPPVEATDLFFQTLRKLSKNGARPIIAIAGNHDSPDRIEAPQPLARACGIVFAGYPHSKSRGIDPETGVEVLRVEEGFIELKLPQLNYPVRIIMTPYANEVRMKRDLGTGKKEDAMRDLLHAHWRGLVDEFCDDKGVNLAVAHLFMIKKGEDLHEEHDDEKPLSVGGAQVVHTQNVPAGIQYMALGHIHGYRNMTGGPCPCVYAGSPLGYSFAERGHEKGVVIVEAEPGKDVSYRKVALTQGRKLERGRFSDIDEAVRWLHTHKEDYVELYIQSKEYIASADRKRLVDAHERMIGPIPDFVDQDNLETISHRKIDLSQSMDQIFTDFFQYRHGQEPSEEIMAIFGEIMGTEVEK